MKQIITGIIYDARGRIIALPIDYYQQLPLIYGNCRKATQIWKNK